MVGRSILKEITARLTGLRMELRRIRTASLDARNNEVIPRIQATVESGKSLALVYLDVADFHNVYQECGSTVATKIIGYVADALEEEVLKVYAEQTVAIHHLWADDFIVLIKIEPDTAKQSLLQMCLELRLKLENHLRPVVVPLIGHQLRLHSGYAVISPDQETNPEIKMYNALKEAQKVARGVLDLAQAAHIQELKDLIDGNQFYPVYQPILSLASGAVLGWEALLRGPSTTTLGSPDIVFPFAEQAGMLGRIESISRANALKNARSFAKGQKLFINVHPVTLINPQIFIQSMDEALASCMLEPDSIVLEITERHNVVDYAVLRKSLDLYRQMGYAVAIDDVGTGYSGLQRIAEIRPDFIKIDMSLIRNLDRDLVRRSCVEALITLARKIDCSVIAEGIETQSELSTLMSIGADFGQGYFLGHPNTERSSGYSKAHHFITSHSTRSGRAVVRKPLTIGDLALPALEVDEHTSVSNVKQLLDSTQHPFSGIVVSHLSKPVGLVMTYNLHRTLGSQYGVALFSRRPIGVIMDRSFLSVDEKTPLQEVSDVATHREHSRLYDDIVVVGKEGHLVGVVPVNRLLEMVNRLQMEIAKGANPLTGLPGNVAIEEEIARRSCTEPAITVVYTDMDRFKAYNDLYGFEAGDKMICKLGRILAHAVRRHGAQQDFVGHIGGDDFLVVSSPAYAEEICRCVVRLFKRTAKGCDVSMAILDHSSNDDLRTLSRRAAHLKRYAKSIPGSVYVKDRRGNSGTQNQEEQEEAARAAVPL